MDAFKEKTAFLSDFSTWYIFYSLYKNIYSLGAIKIKPSTLLID
jgi:hypothetical protein